MPRCIMLAYTPIHNVRMGAELTVTLYLTDSAVNSGPPLLCRVMSKAYKVLRSNEVGSRERVSYVS